MAAFTAKLNLRDLMFRLFLKLFELDFKAFKKFAI